jgi:spore germination protein GerM
VLAAAALVAGCGLPNDDGPEVIDPSSVPGNLLATGGVPSPTPGRGQVVSVFFARGDRLVSRPRRVTSVNVSADTVRALLIGPTPAETTAGLVTAVPADTRLISLDLSGSVAKVDLGAAFGATGGSQQVLAVAQIVYTLTSSPSISRVSFAIDGRSVEVPDGSGSLSTAPRGRDDYRQQSPGG